MVVSGSGENTNKTDFFFMSDILGKKIYAKRGTFIGKVGDVIATVSQLNPEIHGLMLSKAGSRFYLPIQNIDLVRLARSKKLILTEDPPASLILNGSHFLVREILYDKQIVDVNGAKVERVNDVRILFSGERAYLTDVDVGFTGLSRRMGFGHLLPWLAKTIGKEPKEELIPWKFVQPLPERFPGPIQVMLRQEQIRRLHPGELADIIEELDRDDRLALVQNIGAEDAADALEEAPIGVQTSILRDLDTGLAADILEEMEPAVAADVIDKLPVEAKESIMAAMEADERAQIERLVQAEEDTAASLMTVDFISCPETTTAADALELLRRNADEIETITYVYCVNEESRLCGVVSLRELILTKPDAILSGIMNERLATLSPDDDWETVANLFLKLRFKAFPVVDDDRRILGIVTFQHSFDELLCYYNRLAG
jgi:magnesium transporter